MADNYLERQYQEYEAKREAWLRNPKQRNPKGKKRVQNHNPKDP